MGIYLEVILYVSMCLPQKNVFVRVHISNKCNPMKHHEKFPVIFKPQLSLYLASTSDMFWLLEGPH